MARADAGLFTHRINFPIGARLGAAALSRTGAFIGTDIEQSDAPRRRSVVVITAALWLERATVHGSVAATVWLIWQLTYRLDCADGRTVRVTGTSAPVGGRLGDQKT